jgi:arsenate reductase
MAQLLSRCSLIPLVLSLALAQQKTELAATTSSQVLFVCEHGAAKSVIAASYFNKLAAERGLSERAIARGVQPDPVYSSAVVRGLQQDGVSVKEGKPAKVTEADVAKAARVVTLGCKLPTASRSADKAEDWADLPSPSENYSAARQAIRERVEQLVDELSKQKKR